MGAVDVIKYRDADEGDVPAIVAMLADDPLGAEREDVSVPLPQAYHTAFHTINETPGQRLVVAVETERIVGTMQLLVIAGLSFRGSRHGQIEAVRIATDRRGRGAGAAFVRWGIEELRLAGCTSIQLVSHASRCDAHRFWERQGFEATHRGFKMTL
jgi:GNAT superfamily N-acetyltransferase